MSRKEFLAYKPVKAAELSPPACSGSETFPGDTETEQRDLVQPLSQNSHLSYRTSSYKGTVSIKIFYVTLS